MKVRRGSVTYDCKVVWTVTYGETVKCGRCRRGTIRYGDRLPRDKCLICGAKVVPEKKEEA